VGNNNLLNAETAEYVFYKIAEKIPNTPISAAIISEFINFAYLKAWYEMHRDVPERRSPFRQYFNYFSESRIGELLKFKLTYDYEDAHISSFGKRKEYCDCLCCRRMGKSNHRFVFDDEMCTLISKCVTSQVDMRAPSPKPPKEYLDPFLAYIGNNVRMTNTTEIYNRINNHSDGAKKVMDFFVAAVELGKVYHPKKKLDLSVYVGRLNGYGLKELGDKVDKHNKRKEQDPRESLSEDDVFNLIYDFYMKKAS
jgi:hypothetical protein